MAKKKESTKVKVKKSAKAKTIRVAGSLNAVPLLHCSFIVPTENKKGIYLIVDEKDREAVYQVDGFGGEFCRRIDGSRSGEEIAAELIDHNDLPENEFKEYLIALQKDLHANGLLSFQHS